MEMSDSVSDFLTDVAKKTWKKLIKKPFKILLLGSSGVGKTQLIHSLESNLAQVIHHTDRTSYHYSKSQKIKNLDFVIIDTPGQELHEPIRNMAILKHIETTSLIINVVCYGYHEHKYAENLAFTEKSGKISKQYLDKHRKLEMDYITNLQAQLSVYKNIPFLTVVTKADLWWNSKQEILGYYEQGEYADLINRYHFHNPTVQHYCSVFHKFYGKADMAGSFDDSDRLACHAQLLNTIVELVGKGERNV